MKVVMLQGVYSAGLAVVVLGGVGNAVAQAPGGGSSVRNPADITSEGTPRDVSQPAPRAQPPAPAVPPAVGPTTQRRGSMVPMLEPLWVDLTQAQQTALAPFAPEWNTWPMAEKKSWVALADKLPTMSRDNREKAQRRILEWANLSPEQRRLARANYRLAKERPAPQRVEEWHGYQSLTQEQREVLRRAGSTSNTAAGQAGAPTGLAREASQPLSRVPAPPPHGNALVPANSPPR
jgi:hypothetical protein